MRHLLAILAALLLLVLPDLASAQPVVTNAPACVTLAPSGGADDARLQAAVLKAAAQPARCLQLTAGTFHVSTVNAALLTLLAPGFDLGGAGMQQTRLVWADGLVLHNPPYYSFGVLIPAGADTVHIHDLALAVRRGTERGRHLDWRGSAGRPACAARSSRH
jgi:hypothetical protein